LDDASTSSVRDGAAEEGAPSQAMDAGVDSSESQEPSSTPDARGPLDRGTDATPGPSTDAALLDPDSMAMPRDGGDASVIVEDGATAFNGVATIGSPCWSEDAKACAGNNSTDALVCEAGAWRARSVCDGNNRCDTAAGGTRGTCQAIVPECIGKAPSSTFCVGTDRYRCGADLLSRSSAPCPTHTECDEGSCFCSAGYVLNAQKTACVEADVPMQIGAGALSCVLLKSGRVACWRASSLPNPTVIRGPGDSALGAATHLAVGENGACAVLVDGRAGCWGAGSYIPGGGNDLLHASFVKRQDGSDLHSLTQVAIGGSHACAVSTSGSVYCWGGNGARQLGTASAASTVAHAEQVLGIGGSGFLADVRQVAAGNLHTCVRQLGNGVVCWGSNAQGRLGVSTPWPAPPIAIPGFGNPVDISTSALSSSTCAVLDDGTVRCWGANGNGQLGNGNVQDSPSPGPVLSASGVPLAGALEVALGFSSACARTASSVSCWGLNDHGQLGRPLATQQSLFAVAVPGLAGAVHLGQAATATNCVVSQDRRVLCWGAAVVLDGAPADDSSEPVPIWPTWDFMQ
jgi:alpha-tubulin suppressor-like RCC1 family protein